MKGTGLCHSVQGTAETLARWKGKDAYTLLRAAVEKPAIYNEEIVRNEMFLHLGYYINEYLVRDKNWKEEIQAWLDDPKPLDLKREKEDAASIINLPPDACVEVPVGALPPQCAALINLSVAIEEMAVDGEPDAGEKLRLSSHLQEVRGLMGGRCKEPRRMPDGSLPYLRPDRASPSTNCLWKMR